MENGQISGARGRGTRRRLRAAASLAIAVAFLTGGLLSARAAVSHGVAAGMLNVEQISPLDTNNNAKVTLALGINQFRLGTFNRADYDVRIGTWADGLSNVIPGRVDDVSDREWAG